MLTNKLWAERMYNTVEQLDKSYLEMRYKGSVYSAHLHADEFIDSSESEKDDGEEETGLLLNRLPSVGEEEEKEEQKQVYQKQLSEAESSSDPHSAGLGGTLGSAILGIIKGMVGPAILYLPHGFSSAGYLVAIPLLMLSTMLFLWSSSCLLQSWKVESDSVNKKRLSMNNKGYGLRLRKRIILSYPELAYRAFGSRGERLVQLGISLMQSGVCLTYLIFVPQNLRTSALLMFNWNISTSWTLALMVAIQIPLSWIRDIRRLTMTNLLANILILYGLVTCLGFAVDDMGNNEIGETGPNSFWNEVVHRAQSLPAFNPSGWFLFLGTSVLLFEGSITLLVPLQEAVHTPEDRLKFPALYQKVILGIVTFYSFFGLICWMAFGNEVRTVLTVSLPPGTLATTVQLAYSLAVVFTFPLQNFPSLEIVCVTIERMTSDNNGKFGGSGDVSSGTQRNIISSILIVALSIIAMLAMNDLDKVVSLMGSLLGCPLAFVFPPLIQNRLDKGNLSQYRKGMNVVVATLGVAAMFVSSITTLLQWD